MIKVKNLSALKNVIELFAGRNVVSSKQGFEADETMNFSQAVKCIMIVVVAAMCCTAAMAYPEHATREREQARHLLNRMTYGPRPSDIDWVLHIGIDRYIDQQLHPQSITMPRQVEDFVKQSTALQGSPSHLVANYGRPAIMGLKGAGRKDRVGSKTTREDIEARKKAQKLLRNNFKWIYSEVTDARLMRAVYSPRQLQEVMTDFWFNHFNVSINKGMDHLLVGVYEETAIRPYALGKFRDLLGSTAHHAAMLFYLDNWQNTAFRKGMHNGKFRGLNENYARELMELHTLGVDGGYTQKDVVELARVLTGHGILPRSGMHVSGGGSNNSYGYHFAARRHDFTDKVLLGHVIKGSGYDEVDKALNILATHPSTARHISYKLAQYFVADRPPETLVNTLSQTFLKSDGDIKQVLSTLFHSAEFWDAKYYSAKYKTPYRYLISSLRASDATITRSEPLLGFLKIQGMPLYQCQTPDGYKNTQEAWLNPTGLIQRINFASALGAGRHPAVRPRELREAVIMDMVGVDANSNTARVLASTPQRIGTCLLLGSPEFMMH